MSEEADVQNPINTTTHSIIERLLEIGWLLLAINIPLGVNLWGSQPFEPAKVFLLRTLVWWLVAVAATQYLLGHRSFTQEWRQQRHHNPLFQPLLLLALTIVAATFTAVDPSLSLWGSLERAQGTLTLLSYILLFLLLTSRLYTVAQTWRLMIALVLTALPLTICGLAQAGGWFTFGLVTDARSAVFATLGRANFLGAYLVMLLPLTAALGLYVHRQRALMKKLNGVCILAVLLILWISEWLLLVLSQARSAWLASIVSLLVFLLLGWGHRLRTGVRRMAAGGLAFLTLAGPLLVWGAAQAGQGSTAARLAIWRATLTLIRQRPFLGYGPDALGLVFPQVYPPELVYFQGREFFVDRAHNLLLDWAATTGLVGLLLYLTLLATFIICMVQALRRTLPPTQRLLAAAILAAVIGNIANNLTSFDITPTTTLTWLLLGMGISLIRPTAVPPQSVCEWPGRRWPWILPLAVMVGMVVWLANGRVLAADIASHLATKQALAGNHQRAIMTAEKAVSFRPQEPVYRLQLAQLYWQQALFEPALTTTWGQQAEAALLTACDLRPRDPALWVMLAEFYASTPAVYGQGRPSQAHAAFRQAAQLAPNHATIFTAWGRLYLAQNSPAQAALLLRRAVWLDASNGLAYLYLAEAELALGRLEVAIADYQEAVRLEPTSGLAQAGLAYSYWQAGQPEQAAAALRRALQLEPDNQTILALQEHMFP